MNIFKKKQTISDEELAKISVKLKPIMGIRPGYYLTALYLFVVLFLFFFFFFLPGILRNGSILIFKGKPQKINIYIDDTLIGSSPKQLYLKSGEYNLKLECPGFQTEKRKLKVEGRLFASLFFPRRQTVSLSLKKQSAEEYLAYYMKNFSLWNSSLRRDSHFYSYALLSGDYYPPVLNDISRTLKTQFPAFMEKNKEELLLNALSHLQSTAGFLQAGKLYLQSQSPSHALSAQALINSIRQGKKWLEKRPHLLDLFLLNYRGCQNPPGKTTAIAKDSIKLQDSLTFLKISQPASKRKKYINILNRTFCRIPAGQLKFDKSILEIEEFYMAQELLSNQQFNQFLNEEKETARELKKNPDFLRHLDSAANAPNAPVIYIPWKAAKLYCQWLQKKLDKTDYSSWKVDLPHELQWYWAHQSGEDDIHPAHDEYPFNTASFPENNWGVRGLNSSVWQWCREGFQPALYYLLKEGNQSLTDLEKLQGHAYYKNCRGGCWQNIEETKLLARAAQDPKMASPFTGFRIILQRVLNE